LGGVDIAYAGVVNPKCWGIGGAADALNILSTKPTGQRDYKKSTTARDRQNERAKGEENNRTAVRGFLTHTEGGTTQKGGREKIKKYLVEKTGAPVVVKRRGNSGAGRTNVGR